METIEISDKVLGILAEAAVHDASAARLVGELVQKCEESADLPSVLDRVAELGGSSDQLLEICARSKNRHTNLKRALELGAKLTVVMDLAAANRVSPGPSIVLPARYAHCSRAKGWARKGRGDSAQWGEEDGGGYRVDVPGKWVVESSDGFSRKQRTNWTVAHVRVGAETWTTAD